MIGLPERTQDDMVINYSVLCSHLEDLQVAPPTYLYSGAKNRFLCLHTQFIHSFKTARIIYYQDYANSLTTNFLCSYWRHFHSDQTNAIRCLKVLVKQPFNCDRGKRD